VPVGRPRGAIDSEDLFEDDGYRRFYDKYCNLKGDKLVQEIYRSYPYYAINSEIAGCLMSEKEVIAAERPDDASMCFFTSCTSCTTRQNEPDERLPIELTDENQIPDEARAVLKRLGPDDHIPAGSTLEWDWDDGQLDWELSVRDTQADVDCGYVAIVPLKNGDRFEHRIKPPPSHNEWALRFVVPCSTINVAIPDILTKGSLHEAKRRLDMLLGFNTPVIPSQE